MYLKKSYRKPKELHSYIYLNISPQEWGLQKRELNKLYGDNITRLRHKVRIPVLHNSSLLTICSSFTREEDLLEFARTIKASDGPDPGLEYIVTSLNEWQQPQERYRKASDRRVDEGREGYSYRLLRWPAFVIANHFFEAALIMN